MIIKLCLTGFAVLFLMLISLFIFGFADGVSDDFPVEDEDDLV